MSAFTSQGFLEKLSRLTLSQESIETLSLWIIHHKAHAKLAVQLWLQEVKKASADRRLVLFYLANDILQNGRRRGAGEFLDLFQDPLRQTVTMIGGQKIQTSVERMFRIWKERRLYDNAFLKELNQLIEPSRKPEPAEAITEFKLSLLVDALTEFGKFEAELQVKSAQLSNLRVDVSDPASSLSMLKDKSAGGRVSQEFEDASQKLQDYCECLGIEVNERINILDMLKECKTFYTHHLAEVKHAAFEYKKLCASVKSLKLALDQRVKELERAHSTAMSDPSAQEDITDVGDMEIESDGEGQDSNDKTKPPTEPAPPTAPPPLPPPPPSAPPTSSEPGAPGLLVSPPLAPVMQPMTGQSVADGSVDPRQSVPRQPALRQPGQPAYSTMFVDNVYGQHRPPRVAMGTTGRPLPSSQGSRPMRFPMRGRFPVPRFPDGSGRVRFRAPGMMGEPRELRPGVRPRYGSPFINRPPHGYREPENGGFNVAMDTNRSDEDESASPSEDCSAVADAMDAVKNMLIGIAKKNLNQVKPSGSQDEVAQADTLTEGDLDGEEIKEEVGKEEEESSDGHTISAAPVAYSRAGVKAAGLDEEEDEDGIPFSPTTEEELLKKDKDESLPSLSSDSPTVDGSEPNPDNPILQALYGSQNSPNKDQHSPSDTTHTLNPLELLRAEDSDQEEELTSMDLKNILDQVKSGDSYGSDPPLPDTKDDGDQLQTASGAPNIPITPKLTNLLDQIFPQISQSLIDRKRKQMDDGSNGSVVGIGTDVKTPRLGPHAGPPQSVTNQQAVPRPLMADGVNGPARMQPHPQGPLPSRPVQARYAGPRPPGMPSHPSSHGSQGPHGMVRGFPPRAMSRPPRFMTGPPGNLSGPPGNLSGPPGNLAGPPGNLAGPPGNLAGPPGNLSGPSGNLSRPPGNLAGPPGNLSGPPGNLSGPPGNLSGPPGNLSGPPGNLSGPPGNLSGPPRGLPPRGISHPLGMSGPPRNMAPLPPSSMAPPSPGNLVPQPPGNMAPTVRGIPSSSAAGPGPFSRPPVLSSQTVALDSTGSGPGAPEPMDYRYRVPALGMGARGRPRGPRLRIAVQPTGARPPPQSYGPMRPRFA